MAEDPLDRLLAIGTAEGTLGPDTLDEFARALRERAAAILDQRVRGLEEQVARLQGENGWHRETIENLESENHWRREAIESLDKQVTDLQREIEALRSEWRTVATAHDRLLEHHRRLLAWLIEALGAQPGALPWGYRRVRERLAELVDTLRKELS